MNCKEIFYTWLFTVILLVGCASSLEYVPVALTLPPRPILPEVKSAELQCLSDDAYTLLVQRERLQRGHINVLEAIIMSTQRERSSKATP
jgi:hypothetical protein